MASLTSGIPVTAKEARARAEFALGDDYRFGLFRNNAALGRSYGPTTTVKYVDITTGTSDELPTALGYTIGGFALTPLVTGPNNATPTVITGTGAWWDWTTDPTWAAASFTASGGFIYNNTHANKLVLAIIDFGGDKVGTGGAFTYVLPAPAAGTAIFEFA